MLVKRCRRVHERYTSRIYFQCVDCAEVVGQLTSAKRHRCAHHAVAQPSHQLHVGDDQPGLATEVLNARLPPDYAVVGAASCNEPDLVPAGSSAAHAQVIAETVQPGCAAASHSASPVAPDAYNAPASPDSRDALPAFFDDTGNDAFVDDAAHAAASHQDAAAATSSTHAAVAHAVRSDDSAVASAAAAAAAAAAVVAAGVAAAQQAAAVRPLNDGGASDAVGIVAGSVTADNDVGTLNREDQAWKEEQALAVWEDINYDDNDVDIAQVLADSEAYYIERGESVSSGHALDWSEVAGLPVCEALDAFQRAQCDDPEQHSPFTVRQAAAGVLHVISDTS